jgi:hypothetical protein
MRPRLYLLHKVIANPLIGLNNRTYTSLIYWTEQTVYFVFRAQRRPPKLRCVCYGKSLAEAGIITVFSKQASSRSSFRSHIITHTRTARSCRDIHNHHQGSPGCLRNSGWRKTSPFQSLLPEWFRRGCGSPPRLGCHSATSLSPEFHEVLSTTPAQFRYQCHHECTQVRVCSFCFRSMESLQLRP